VWRRQAELVGGVNREKQTMNDLFIACIESLYMFPRRCKIVQKNFLNGYVLGVITPYIPGQWYKSDKNIEYVVFQMVGILPLPFLPRSWMDYGVWLHFFDYEIDLHKIPSKVAVPVIDRQDPPYPWNKCISSERGLICKDFEKAIRVIACNPWSVGSQDSYIGYFMDQSDYLKIGQIGRVFQIKPDLMISPFSFDERRISLLKFLISEYPYTLIHCTGNPNESESGSGWKEVGGAWLAPIRVDVNKLYSWLEQDNWKLFTPLNPRLDFKIPKFESLSESDLDMKLKENGIKAYLWSEPEYKQWIIAINHKLDIKGRSE
jgi:hypothetical protein